MYHYYCLNPISQVGIDAMTEKYVPVSDPKKADALLVRSAGMHEMEFSQELKAIARAGAGVNNIPLERCAEEGIVVFNTPGANANGVKELVIAGMLLASRDIIGGINWVQENEEDGNIAKDTEKAKKAFAGWQTRASIWAWRSSALTPTSPWTRHGDCPGTSTTPRQWMNSTRTATISQSTCPPQ